MHRELRLDYTLNITGTSTVCLMRSLMSWFAYLLTELAFLFIAYEDRIDNTYQ